MGDIVGGIGDDGVVEPAQIEGETGDVEVALALLAGQMILGVVGVVNRARGEEIAGRGVERQMGDGGREEIARSIVAQIAVGGDDGCRRRRSW